MGQLPIFLGDKLWEKLQAEAKKEGRKDIAVAYITEANSVPLGRKDRVLADFSEVSVKAGKSDPKVALKALKNGAEIYNDSKLHAKVYILQDCVIVGSANLSDSSKSMHEAGMLDFSPELRRQATEWFENNLRNKHPMTEQELKKLKDLFRENGAISTGTKRKISLYEVLKTESQHLDPDRYAFSWWVGEYGGHSKNTKEALKKSKDMNGILILKNWNNFHKYFDSYQVPNKKGLTTRLDKVFGQKILILFEVGVDIHGNINKFKSSLRCQFYLKSLLVNGAVESITELKVQRQRIAMGEQINKELFSALTRGIKNLKALGEKISGRDTGEINLKELKAIFKKGESL